MRQLKIEAAVQIHGENGLGKYVKLQETKKKHEAGNCILNMYNEIKNAEDKGNLIREFFNYTLFF